MAWSALAWCFVIRLEEWDGCVFRGGFIQVVFCRWCSGDDGDRKQNLVVICGHGNGGMLRYCANYGLSYMGRLQ